MTTYKSVKLPKGLVDAISDFIEAQKKYGFNSIVDFVKDSIRKNLKNYQKKGVKNEDLDNSRIS